MAEKKEPICTCNDTGFKIGLCPVHSKEEYNFENKKGILTDENLLKTPEDFKKWNIETNGVTGRLSGFFMVCDNEECGIPILINPIYFGRANRPGVGFCGSCGKEQEIQSEIITDFMNNLQKKMEVDDGGE